MGYTPGAKREVSSSTGYLVGVVNGLVFAAIGVALTASTGAKLFGVSHEELANSTKQDGVFRIESLRLSSAGSIRPGISRHQSSRGDVSVSPEVFSRNDHWLRCLALERSAVRLTYFGSSIKSAELRQQHAGTS